MDRTLGAIADYAVGRRYDDLDTTVIGVYVDRLIDTVACALGGLAEEPARQARAIAAEDAVGSGCTVWGSGTPGTPEAATFANTVAVRLLDYNDHYPGSGHPSDMVPGILAAAEVAGASGADVLVAMDVAYEVATALGDAYAYRAAGFDQGSHVAAGVAAATSRVLGATAAQTADAVALAVTATMPMRATRAGELSVWKGCATALVARNALLLARVAMRGFTGPPRPFDGVDGLDRHVPRRAPLRLGEPRDGLPAVRRTNVKFFPTEGNSQAVLDAVLRLRAEFDPADLVRLDIETYHTAWHEIGGGQGDRAQKWDPRTRETADHSLPYLVAVMLVDGRVDLDSFRPQRVGDPALRPVMAAIAVTEASDLTARHPRSLDSRLRVTLRDGTVLGRETSVAPGNWANPLTPDQLAEKYARMAAHVRPAEGAADLLAALRALPEAADVRAVTAALARLSPASPR